MALTKATYGMISADTSTIDLNIDANTLYVDSSANKVGIGTNSPDAKLRIDQDSTAVALKVTGGGSGVNIAEFSRDIGATASVNINASGAEPQIAFVDANTFSIGVNSTYFEIADNTHIGTNTRFVIDNTGNVGIGTASPDRQLEVEGQGVLRLNTTGSNTDPGIDFNTSSANDMQIRYRGGTDKLAVYSYGTTSDVLTIQKSDGRVGIGITSPEAPLHIEDSSSSSYGGLRVVGAGTGAGSTNVRQIADFGRTNSGSVSGVWLGGRTDETTAVIGAKTASGNIAFEVYNSGWQERMRITNAGNVGIGTSSPSTKLHVFTAGHFKVDTGSSPIVEIANNSATSSTSGTATLKFTQANTQAGGKIVSGRDGDYSNGSTRQTHMAFYTATTASDTEKMRITATGNVGIGEDTPATKLHVVGGRASGTMYNTAVFAGGQNSTSGSGARLYISGCENDPLARGTIIEGKMNDNGNSHELNFYTSGNSQAPAKRLTIDNNGKVRIGATLGLNHLLNIQTASSSGLAQMEFRNTQAGTQIGMPANTNALSFFTADAERIRITNTGNVGIGITDPDQALEIGAGGKLKLSRADNSRSMLLYTNNADCVIQSDTDPLHLQSANRMTFATNGASERMRIAPDGNVGIGTTSPNSPLHVKTTNQSIQVRNTGNDNVGLEIYRDSDGAKGASIGWGNGNANLEIKNYRNDGQSAGPYANIDFFTGGTDADSPDFNPTRRMRIQQTGEVGIGTDNPLAKLHLESGSAHNKLSITSTASGGTGYDAVIDLLGSAANSETAINMGINGDADREQIKAYQSYLSLRTNNVERISYQPTQGSVYENIFQNFTQGNLNLSLLRGMRFARAGSIADDTKIKLFQGSYTYSGGTIDYVITDGAGSQNHVGSGTINWYSREAVCHFTLTGTNVSNKIVVNADTSTGTYADGKFTIAIRATNGDSHMTIMNRLGSTIYIGLKISVNYVG